MDAYKPKLTLRSYLHALNYKANHRKILVTDAGDTKNTLITLITSANPHDGSSRHSNVGFQIIGDIGWDVIRSEEAVANFSDSPFILPHFTQKNTDTSSDTSRNITAQLLTEKSIKKSILDTISQLKT